MWPPSTSMWSYLPTTSWCPTTSNFSCQKHSSLQRCSRRCRSLKFQVPKDNEQFGSAFALLLSIYDIHTIYFLELFQKENIHFLPSWVFSCIQMYYILCTYHQKSKNLFFPLSVWFFAKTNINFVPHFQKIQWDIFNQKQKLEFFPSIQGFFINFKIFPNLAHHG